MDKQFLETRHVPYLIIDNTKKNGTKICLVPLDAELSVKQHIQNPLKSVLGKIAVIKVLILQ